jgi:hypothetical protein
MSLHYYFRNPDGDMEDISHRMRKYALTVTESAEEFQPASSTVIIDDPDGDFEITGHRLFQIVEDEIPGDDNVIFSGYTYDQRIRRGPYRDGAAREWEVRLVDVNTVVTRRFLTEEDDDADRPAETDVERLQWLLGLHATELIDDDRYLDTTNPVDMDAVNYDGQMVDSVLRDLTRVSLKNIYITHFANPTPDPLHFVVFSLVYMHDSSDEYSSAIRISNVLADIGLEDYETREVFEPSLDSELERRPDRIFSKIRVPYDGGFATDERTETATAFARLDAIMPEINVKSEAKAEAIIAAQLEQLKTQEEVITTSIYVPNAQVNDVRPGMRIQVKYSHFPGYEQFVWGRVLQRTVSNEESEHLYKVTLEITVGPEFAAPGVFQYTEHGSASIETENGDPVSRTTLDTPPGVGSIILAMHIQGPDTDSVTWPDDADWTEIDKVELGPVGIGPGFATMRWRVSRGPIDQDLLILKNGTFASYTVLVEMIGVSSVIDFASEQNTVSGPPPAPSIGPVTSTADDQIVIGFAMIAGIDNDIFLEDDPPWIEMENGASGASPTVTAAYIIGTAGNYTLTATSDTTGGDQGKYSGILAVFG